MLDQKTRVSKNRVPHYSYGRDQVNYLTVSKEVHSNYGVSNTASVERAQNGKDLRTTHFWFGTDKNTSAPDNLYRTGFRTPATTAGQSRSFSQTPDNNGPAKTNISLSHARASAPGHFKKYETTYDSQGQSKSQTQSAKDIGPGVNANDLKKSHLVLGGH